MNQIELLRHVADNLEAGCIGIHETAEAAAANCRQCGQPVRPPPPGRKLWCIATAAGSFFAAPSLDAAQVVVHHHNLAAQAQAHELRLPWRSMASAVAEWPHDAQSHADKLASPAIGFEDEYGLCHQCGNSVGD